MRRKERSRRAFEASPFFKARKVMVQLPFQGRARACHDCVLTIYILGSFSSKETTPKPQTERISSRRSRGESCWLAPPRRHPSDTRGQERGQVCIVLTFSTRCAIQTRMPSRWQTDLTRLSASLRRDYVVSEAAPEFGDPTSHINSLPNPGSRRQKET